MKETKRLRGWRRIANAMWGPPNDPQIYGAIEIEATKLQHFMETCRSHGHKVTPTHLVGRAIGLMLRDVPELNVRIVGERIVPRESADVFFITAVEGGRDLSGVKIESVDGKSAMEIARELTERATLAKEGRDPDLAKSKGAMNALPMPMLRVALKATGSPASAINRCVRSVSRARRSEAPRSRASACSVCRSASRRSVGCTRCRFSFSSAPSPRSRWSSTAGSRRDQSCRSLPRSTTGTSMGGTSLAP